jgi:SAM-dependent methyltransferase
MLTQLKDMIKKIPFAVPVVRFLKQLLTQVKGKWAPPPLPSPDLIYLVAGTDNPEWFLHSGALGAQRLSEVMAKHNVRLEKLKNVLDFGCGVGRVLRHFHRFKGPKFYGTDYNVSLIKWCQENLKFAECQVNQLDSKLSYPDEKFDLVYALSVFTHLSETLQFFWLDELARITKPGGHLFITLHGDFYISQIKPENQQRFLRGELVVQDECGRQQPMRRLAPKAYVEQKMTKNLELIEHIPEAQPATLAKMSTCLENLGVLHKKCRYFYGRKIFLCIV